MTDEIRTAARVAKLLRKDVRRCVELEHVLFPDDDPWSFSAFTSAIDRGHYYIGAFDTAENLLGYAGLGLLGLPPGAEAEVHTIGVDPALRRQGVGRLLLRHLLAEADAHHATTFLEVRTDNEPAILLYQAHGFEIVGLRPRYYQPSGADAHTMRRPARSEMEER